MVHAVFDFAYAPPPLGPPLWHTPQGRAVCTLIGQVCHCDCADSGCPVLAHRTCSLWRSRKRHPAAAARRRQQQQQAVPQAAARKQPRRKSRVPRKHRQQQQQRQQRMGARSGSGRGLKMGRKRPLLWRLPALLKSPRMLRCVAPERSAGSCFWGGGAERVAAGTGRGRKCVCVSTRGVCSVCRHMECMRTHAC